MQSIFQMQNTRRAADPMQGSSSYLLEQQKSVGQPTFDAHWRTVHPPLLHQNPDGLQLRHDFVFLILSHRLYAAETNKRTGCMKSMSCLS